MNRIDSNEQDRLQDKPDRLQDTVKKSTHQKGFIAKKPTFKTVSLQKN